MGIQNIPSGPTAVGRVLKKHLPSAGTSAWEILKNCLILGARQLLIGMLLSTLDL